jgi:heme b synthase
MTHPHATHGREEGAAGAALRLVAWETTRNCNLACVHCRASATCGPYAGELDTAEGFRLLEQIAELGRPIVILTGGEPLLRPDIYALIRHGDGLGLRMVMAPNGTLITAAIAAKLAACGIKRLSISLDGAAAETHDAFRQVPGAFAGGLKGIELIRQAGIPFQINTTVTQDNLAEIPAIHALAIALGAVAHHIFLLVPTGRGKYIVDRAIDAEQYEATLNWFYEQRGKSPLELKATCAPHYYRILRQRSAREGKPVSFQSHGLDAVTRGCLGGIGFCFVSHVGDVQPCGFLDTPCGNVREKSFVEIWKNAEVFTALRDYRRLEGKCGRCEFTRVCGGCRARAFEATGNYLAAEPLCTHLPRGGA